MARKSDFTEQEWEAMQKGVTGAGLLVSIADRSFFESFKEAGVLAKHLAQARKDEGSELLRELAAVRGTGFGLRSSPEELERETLQAIRSGIATLESKAPDEVDPYRRFVVDVAESVAEAAGGVASRETGAIDKIKDAVGGSSTNG